MSYQRGLAARLLAVLLAACVSETAPAADVTPDENHIKLIIDVSGSMKKNDPENLRRPAVNLLMNLLPEDASAGIWLFGDQVETLVPFAPATSAFKQSAIDKSNQIHSKGLLTDVGAALEQAMLTPPLDSKAILLSDGMVDLGPDSVVNDAERVRIRHRLVPGLRANGAGIHTIALSDQADEEVLSEIALGTGGLFETASSPEDLTRIFLRLFDDAVIQDRLPIEDGVFLVDSTVEEFTLLAFHDADATPIQLRSPYEEFYLETDHPDNVKWYQDAGYDLITITEPMEGEWRLFADEDPQNRVTALSDLKLQVTNLQNMIHEGSIPELDVQFFQASGLVTDAEFLDLMDVQLIVLTPAGKRIAKPLSEYNDGTFSSNLGIFAEPGRYLITVNVDGRTFKREVVQEVEYGSPARVAYSVANQTLTVRPVAVGMIGKDLRMIARLVGEDAKKKLIPLTHDGEVWQTRFEDIDPGVYEVTVHVKGVANTGQPLDFDLQTLRIEVAIAGSANEVLEEGPWTVDNFAMIAAVVLGNLALLGLIIWLVRRKSASKDPEVEDLIAQAKVQDDSSSGAQSDLEGAVMEAKALQEAAGAAEQNAPDQQQSAATEIAPEPEPTPDEFQSGQGLSDIVDAWGDDDEGESDPAAGAGSNEPITFDSADDAKAEAEQMVGRDEEVDENAQTVQLDADDQEPEELDENAQTIQLDSPVLADAEAESAGDDEDDELPPRESASSG